MTSSTTSQTSAHPIYFAEPVVGAFDEAAPHEGASPLEAVGEQVIQGLIYQHLLLNWVDVYFPDGIPTPPNIVRQDKAASKDHPLVAQAFRAFEHTVTAFGALYGMTESLPVDKRILVDKGRDFFALDRGGSRGRGFARKRCASPAGSRPQ